VTVDLPAGDDDIRGGDQADVIRGGKGRDVLFGGGGRDTILGGGGHDYLHGGTSADVLDRGTGRDYLLGRKGNDTLDGGEARGTAEEKPKDHWNQLWGGGGEDECPTGPGAGPDNTDYRNRCELPEGANAGWPNGSRKHLSRLPL